MYAIFFFNSTATTQIYTLSLHDALPISHQAIDPRQMPPHPQPSAAFPSDRTSPGESAFADPPSALASSPSDRKSTRLNSSHLGISYAVFCLKKKNNETKRLLRDIQVATK